MSESTHVCRWLNKLSPCTDLACLCVLQCPCSASSLLLEEDAHFVLQLLIVLEQEAELLANVHRAAGES